MRWTENCPNCQGQRTVVIGTNSTSTWRSVHSGIPQVLMLESVLFDSVINELNNGTECIFGKCVDGTNLVTVHGCVAIQRKIDKLQKCTSSTTEKAKCCIWGGKAWCTSAGLGWQAGKQLGRKEAGCSGAKKIEHEPTIFPCSPGLGSCTKRNWMCRSELEKGQKDDYRVGACVIYEERMKELRLFSPEEVAWGRFLSICINSWLGWRAK